VAARVQRDEAKRLRETIDEALMRALSPSMQASPLRLPRGAEDLRDSFTRWFDHLLIGGATLPSYLSRRLESAFDEAVVASGLHA
jgi:hypothetical protein